MSDPVYRVTTNGHKFRVEVRMDDDSWAKVPSTVVHDTYIDAFYECDKLNKRYSGPWIEVPGGRL